MSKITKDKKRRFKYGPFKPSNYYFKYESQENSCYSIKIIIHKKSKYIKSFPKI